MQVPTITKNQYTDEPHPWDWFIPEGTHKLFIGTFPTEKSNRKYDFFYSGATNRFWEVMTELAKPLNEIENEIENESVLEREGEFEVSFNFLVLTILYIFI